MIPELVQVGQLDDILYLTIRTHDSSESFELIDTINTEINNYAGSRVVLDFLGQNTDSHFCRVLACLDSDRDGIEYCLKVRNARYVRHSLKAMGIYNPDKHQVIDRSSKPFAGR